MGEGKVDLCCVVAISRVLSEVEVSEKDEVVEFLGIRTIKGTVLVTPPTIPAGMTGIRRNANQFHRNATGIRWNRYKLPYLGTPLVNNII